MDMIGDLNRSLCAYCGRAWTWDKQAELWVKLEPIQPTGTEARVCEDIAARQQLGITKYGTTVEDNPLTLLEWLRHSYNEKLDDIIYMRRAIEEMEMNNASTQTP